MSAQSFVVVAPQIVGNSDNWMTAYYSDLERHSTRAAAKRHGVRSLGHDDFLLAVLNGDVLVTTAYMDEDRPEEVGERDDMAKQLGWSVPDEVAS